MKEAGKRCLRVTRVRVQKAQSSAKAKTIGESDQGSEIISLMARSCGQENEHDYWRLIFSFNRLTLTPLAPIFVFKRSAGGLKSEGKLSQLPSNTFNELLATWQAGDDEALRAAFPRVYDELRRVAHRYLKKNVPTTPFKVPPSSTRPICGSKGNARVRSRTASISSPSARN